MQKIPPITKAVIPVGGLGIRFLPVTRTVPKPLLPILNVPVIEYAVREAAAAGVGAAEADLARDASRSACSSGFSKSSLCCAAIR